MIKEIDRNDVAEYNNYFSTILLPVFCDLFSGRKSDVTSITPLSPKILYTSL